MVAANNVKYSGCKASARIFEDTIKPHKIIDINKVTHGIYKLQTQYPTTMLSKSTSVYNIVTNGGYAPGNNIIVSVVICDEEHDKEYFFTRQSYNYINGGMRAKYFISPDFSNVFSDIVDNWYYISDITTIHDNNDTYI